MVFDVSLETQPTLLHSIGYDVGSLPLAMVTLGPDFGSDRVRFGPYATGGVLAVGGGARVRAPLVTNDNGSRHNVEVRAGWLALNNLEATVLWTFQTRLGKRP